MRWMMTLLLGATILVACDGTRRNPEACCETIEECNRLGTPEPVLCQTGQCVNFTCVEGLTCDSGDDCPSGECLNNECVVEVPPDAPVEVLPAFDVAYPNVWRRSVSDPISFCLVVINTSSTPLSLASLTLKSIADDHPTANVRLVLEPMLDSIIQPHKAGGLIMPVANQVMIDSGLVPEVRTDTTTSYFQYEIQDAPPGAYTIKVDAIFALDGIDVPLRFTINMQDGPTVYADPVEGVRLHFVRP